MAKSAGQKLKLLYIIRLLTENTDEDHPVSTADIIAYLESKGIRSERKSIYDDIEKLCEFGYDIIQVHSRLGGGYYLAGRDFELAELKLLVDAVQASRFITTRKSRSLIKKLERLAGKHDAGKLQRQVYVAGRIKTENESIYYNIDNVHRAIQENKQIEFQYLDWNLKKELVPRIGSKRQVSPWALIWREENYYLLAWDEPAGMMKHYRVDKMAEVEELPEGRLGQEQFETLDLAQYADRTFGMFGGSEATVQLRFPEKLAGVVLDRFGRDIPLRRDRDGLLLARVDVMVSDQFYGWLAGLGSRIEVAGPPWVREEYCGRLREILERYTGR